MSDSLSRECSRQQRLDMNKISACLSLFFKEGILNSPVSEASFYSKTLRQMHKLQHFLAVFLCPLLLATQFKNPDKTNYCFFSYRGIRSNSLPSSTVHNYLSHHLIYPLNHEGRWGITDGFTTSFLHFSLFSTALWDLPNSRPVHSLKLSSHLFLCLPDLLFSFTVPCKMVLARPDERETCPYHCSLCLFTMVRRSPCGPVACWVLARTSSLVTWSLYEMRSILR